MLNFDQISSRVFAAVSSLTATAFVLAVAIAPATPNATMTGMIA
ncbi:hypothetical protein [Pontixanthobacter aquaemixtae]|nr:hypothetical protein [Pontixanthobacter aquaemixtae]